MQEWGRQSRSRTEGRNMGTNGGRFRGASDMGPAIHLGEAGGTDFKQNCEKCKTTKIFRESVKKWMFYERQGWRPHPHPIAYGQLFVNKLKGIFDIWFNQLQYDFVICETDAGETLKFTIFFSLFCRFGNLFSFLAPPSSALTVKRLRDPV